MSEKVHCQQLWERLPHESLIILDRHYGQAPMLGALQPQCEARGSHFLVRVRDKLNVKARQAHADGSATVGVTLSEPAPADESLAKPAGARGRPRKHPACKVSELEVREVRGRVLRSSDGKWGEVRLWTSLSPQQASAEQLLRLDARRWEQEIFYKELKLQVNQGDLLGGQRTETAAQQVAAMMIACSLLAEERLAVAQSCEGEDVRRAGAVRISFSLCQECVVALKGIAGTHGRTGAGRTRQTCPSTDRRPAATMTPILPVQSPPPYQQMAAHARAIFNAHLETLRRLADCLATLGLNCGLNNTFETC